MVDDELLHEMDFMSDCENDIMNEPAVLSPPSAIYTPSIPLPAGWASPKKAVEKKKNLTFKKEDIIDIHERRSSHPQMARSLPTEVDMYLSKMKSNKKGDKMRMQLLQKLNIAGPPLGVGGSDLDTRDRTISTTSDAIFGRRYDGVTNTTTKSIPIISSSSKPMLIPSAASSATIDKSRWHDSDILKEEREIEGSDYDSDRDLAFVPPHQLIQRGAFSMGYGHYFKRAPRHEL